MTDDSEELRPPWAFDLDDHVDDEALNDALLALAHRHWVAQQRRRQ